MRIEKPLDSCVLERKKGGGASVEEVTPPPQDDAPTIPCVAARSNPAETCGIFFRRIFQSPPIKKSKVVPRGATFLRLKSCNKGPCKVKYRVFASTPPPLWDQLF